MDKYFIIIIWENCIFGFFGENSLLFLLVRIIIDDDEIIKEV